MVWPERIGITSRDKSGILRTVVIRGTIEAEYVVEDNRPSERAPDALASSPPACQIVS